MIKSKSREGTVYLVGVPIGNYQDITFRALETLKKVDLILCEDTRETQYLLNEFLIKKNLVSYVGSKDFAYKKALEIIEQGKSIGVVSDRGMLGISDPGAELVSFFRSLTFNVEIIPGVSAVTAAFSLAGLNGGFNFIGFLPRKESAVKREIANQLQYNNNLMFFESSHRISKTLKIISSVVDGEIYILRELTKTYQEVLVGGALELAAKEIKGEIVVIIPNLK